jgi:ATP:ADP antiporter, AAA family
MKPSARRALGGVVNLRNGEATTTLLLFAYSFLAMTSYNILRPLTRSAFIDQLGADNLPYVLFVAGILIGVLMHWYGNAIRRLPRQWVIPITQMAIVVVLVVFWGLLRTGAAWVTVAFYFLGLILGIFLISQFWTLANELYDARQAKRLFGFIGGGASLGGALGATLTTVVVQRIGTENMLLVSAAVLAVCAGIVVVLVRGQQSHSSSDPVHEAQGVGAGEALRLLSESRHVRIIAVIIGFAAAGAAIIDQQLSMAADANLDGREAIAAFLAQVQIYVSVAGFVVQVGLTSRIHRSFGLAVALLLLPVGLGGTAVVILASGAMWATAAARVLDATMRYTIDKTSREVLFLPLPADLKARAKPFIDVTADRVAKALTALVLLVLVQPWGVGLDWRRLSYASLAVTIAWVAAALIARREYLRAFRASIGSRAIAPEAVRADVADAATIEALVEELSSPDERAVLYAIGMLEALDKRNLVTPLLLHHESPRVRARALVALGSARAAGTARWTNAVSRLLTDEDVGVRAAAMRALTVLRPQEARALVRGYLDDPEPRIAVTAAVGLADSESDADVDAAFDTLQRLVADTRISAAAGRLEAARALAHVRHPRFRPLVVPLLHDADMQVAREAIRSARDLGAADGLFVPGLLSLLGHRMLKRAARDALVSYKSDVVPMLGYVLRDRREHAWVRRHVPVTLAYVPSQQSMDLLVEALDDPDGFVRFKALEALERLRSDDPSLVFASDVVERLLLKETSRYYNYFTLQYNLLQHPTGGRSLLARALEDKLGLLLDRVYRMLRLLYPDRGVEEARHAIERGDRRRQAAAVEYLDTLLTGTIRRRVTPILERMPVEDKVRQANLVLKSRPRDVDDTLAQLVHDSDPVVSAAAIRFVEQQRRWSLSDDIEYVLAHRPAQDRYVLEAALSACSARKRPAGPSRDEEELPVVDIADRLRGSPLGEYVTVDELFRLAQAGQQVRYATGRPLCEAGSSTEHVWVVLDGTVRLERPDEAPRQVEAPAVVGLEDVLQGEPSTHTIVSVEGAVCLRIGGGDLLTMLSDNVALAQGLFRMLLAMSGRVWPAVYTPSPEDALPRAVRTLPLQPIDTVLLLRQHPLFVRAAPAQLFELVGITRHVSLAAGRTLFTEDEPAAIYYILEGEVRLESGQLSPLRAPEGVTLCVAEALAGVACGWRAIVVREGHALRLDRDELFGILADRVELLQGLFSGVLALSSAQQLPVRTRGTQEVV